MRNKVLPILFFLFLLPWSIRAQYDFPVVINGLSIGLELDGQRMVYARDFLAFSSFGCEMEPSLKINRSTLVFPRDTVPPTTATDHLTFDCNDFGTESIELWYQDRYGQWTVADSYVVIFGLGVDCGDCSGAACSSSSPLLYNGLSVSTVAGDNVSVAAREVVSYPVPNEEQYSFSEDINDTVRTYNCQSDFLNPVLIYRHQPGFIPTVGTHRRLC
ncbi:MAG: hypothetical protein AAF828_10645 [Bacteroidota bacterium]